MDGVVSILAVLVLLGVLAVLGCLMVVLYGYIILTYILEGKALYAIARRRDIEKPWLAWVPVGKFWLLGAISDQYRYVVHGQVRNRRKLLLWLDIVLVAAALVFTLSLQIWSVRSAYSAALLGSEEFLPAYLMGLLTVCLVTFVFITVAKVISVFQYMAYYDLFRSCEPKKSLVFLLVSIFAVYPLPFFVYSCRNKDLGMPPRKDASDPE